MSGEFLREIEDLTERDGRYKKEAYFFVYDALQYTLDQMGKTNEPREERHISGRIEDFVDAYDFADELDWQKHRSTSQRPWNDP
jgi:hypothetical protein